MQGICLSMPLSGVNSQDAFLAVPLSALILHDVSVCFYRVSQDVSVCLQRVSVCKPSLCLCLRLIAHEVVVPLLFLSYFAGHLSLSLSLSLTSHFARRLSVFELSFRMQHLRLCLCQISLQRRYLCVCQISFRLSVCEF